MRILLVSTYELGHQPLHVASPAARLRAAGHDVRALDLAVEEWDEERAAWPEAVAISVPMHTAMRLGVTAARRLRETRPDLPVCLYGLYAPVARELTSGLADRVIAGEYEAGLLDWVAELGGAATSTAQVVHLGRGREAFLAPARDVLPSLERYARLLWRGEERVAGYVEATHGCAHRCAHCPVPTVYDGQFRVVGVDTVLADVERLVRAGARHVTFGDPDFLNGPAHALRVMRAVHEAFPDLTFDATVKVEHVLAHAALWPELAAAGLIFVVSAFETTDRAQLDILGKGHTAADMSAAVSLLRGHGVEVRPSWMPFTPWTTRDHVADILAFTLEHRLVANTDPVQYSIRLLVPDGSLLLAHPAMAEHVGAYDPERLTWTWRNPDPEVDALQARIAAVAEARQSDDAVAVLAHIAQDVFRTAGREAPSPDEVAAAALPDVPALSEPWFCCAEPTEGQLGILAAPSTPGCG